MARLAERHVRRCSLRGEQALISLDANTAETAEPGAGITPLGPPLAEPIPNPFLTLLVIDALAAMGGDTALADILHNPFEDCPTEHAVDRRVWLACQVEQLAQQITAGTLIGPQQLAEWDASTNHAAMNHALVRVREDIEAFAAADETKRQARMAVVGGVVASLTTGVVTWVLRAGAFIASLVSALPMWRRFDALPILAAREREETDVVDKDAAPDREDSAVERMFERDSALPRH